MKTRKTFKITVIAILVVSLVSMSFKIIPIVNSYDSFLPKEVYKVNYSYFTKANNDYIFIKSYLPQNNERQKISSIKNESPSIDLNVIDEDENKRIVWRSTEKNSDFYEVNYSFIFKGKAKKYVIADNLPIPSKYDKSLNKYLKSEIYMEVKSPKIKSLADTLTVNSISLKEKIKSIYDYVYSIPSAPIKDVTSALATLEQNRASCNGKSRLFVSLCRSEGIPARLVGGIVLEKTEKKTSHLWAEVFIQNNWVPFDALNGHFAYLPANFLELYVGDHFLITRTPNILFEYEYKIEEVSHIPLLNIDKDEHFKNHPISLLKLSESDVIPESVLLFFLLLPLGGLLISLFKNVVGLKTYGIFLPILIAYTFTNTGYLVGISLFAIILLLVAALSLPLNKWGLLYTPKIVIILTVTILFIFIIISLGVTYNISWMLALSFFPIIITAIMAERFARAIDEDGYEEAASKMVQTLIVTSFCFLVFKAVAIKSILLMFPELILIMVAANLMLGKWIGLRLVEYHRFRHIIE